jgi:hypothetical protein
MAWLAVDDDGVECIYDEKPIRSDVWKGEWRGGYYIILKKGDIEKLTGVKLNWEDEPIEHK